MSRRLVPAYVEKPAWEVYDAFVQWLDDDDLDRLRERAYWQDVGLEPAERVTLETARWSR